MKKGTLLCIAKNNFKSDNVIIGIYYSHIFVCKPQEKITLGTKSV